MTTPTKPKISQIRDFVLELTQLPNNAVIGLPLVSSLPTPVYGAIDLANPITTSGTLSISKIANFTVSVKAVKLNEFALPDGDVSLNGNNITNLQNPALPTDAVNKAYVDSLVAGIVGGAAVNNKREFFGGGISTYALAFNPASNSEFIYVNGQLMRAGSLNDYTIVGLSLIFNYPTVSDDIIAVYYSLT